MALTLTAEELLDALEGPAADGQDRAQALAVVTRLRAVVAEILVKRAPHAPDAISNECAIRLLGWLREQPAVVFTRQSPFAAAWVASGCGALAKPWVRRRGVVGREDDA